jgi:hypothetical protein
MKHLLTFALIGVLAIGLATEARADPVVFDFTGAPEFSNSGAPALIGSVKVTISDIVGGVEVKTEVSGLNAAAKLFSLYLNIDPYKLPTSVTNVDWVLIDVLSFSPNNYKADGDGYFDHRVTFDKPFNSGTASYELGGYTSTNFLAWSQPGPGSDPSKGPFMAAIHVGDVSGDNTDSGWYAATGGDTPPIPEPGSLALLGAGVLGLVWYRRRKSS